MADSDALIVERTLRGDGEAYVVLVERYQSAVLAQALAVTGRLADAEDIAQEAFLKAYRALPGLKRPSAFARWLFGITRNTCHDWLRHRQRREAAGLAERGAGRVADPVDPGAVLPAEDAARRETHRLLLAAVTTLPAEYAVAVTLKHQSGMTCAEIAETLDVPLGTVTSRLARAYEMLRRLLEDRAAGPVE